MRDHVNLWRLKALVWLLSDCLLPSPLRTHACRFRSEGYTVHVQLNDYLDIICPHYEDDSVAAAAMEQYTLYLVELEQYQACQPESKSQVRWQCNHPNARHGPEKLSEKFLRYTPFTLGKEFKEGHSYYYICESPEARAEVPTLGDGATAMCMPERVLSGESGSRGLQSWILFSFVHVTSVE